MHIHPAVISDDLDRVDLVEPEQDPVADAFPARPAIGIQFGHGQFFVPQAG